MKAIHLICFTTFFFRSIIVSSDTSNNKSVFEVVKNVAVRTLTDSNFWVGFGLTTAVGATAALVKNQQDAEESDKDWRDYVDTLKKRAVEDHEKITALESNVVAANRRVKEAEAYYNNKQYLELLEARAALRLRPTYEERAILQRELEAAKEEITRRQSLIIRLQGELVEAQKKLNKQVEQVQQARKELDQRPTCEEQCILQRQFAAAQKERDRRQSPSLANRLQRELIEAQQKINKQAVELLEARAALKLRPTYEERAILQTELAAAKEKLNQQATERLRVDAELSRRPTCEDYATLQRQLAAAEKEKDLLQIELTKAQKKLEECADKYALEIQKIRAERDLRPTLQDFATVYEKLANTKEELAAAQRDRR